VLESGQLYQIQEWSLSCCTLFDDESFNRPFVLTTTQRFLITIFSNKHADKLKLASFRNSLLIINEVQIIPKYILGTLIDILKAMYQFYLYGRKNPFLFRTLALFQGHLFCFGRIDTYS
jgi:hypothetical protein